MSLFAAGAIIAIIALICLFFSALFGFSLGKNFAKESIQSYGKINIDGTIYTCQKMQGIELKTSGEDDES